MIEPTMLTELEKNRVMIMYSKLSAKLTQDLIKKLKEKGDLSSYTKAQIRALARIDGKEVYKKTLLEVNELSKEQKEAIQEVYTQVAVQEMRGYKAQYDYAEVPFELSKSQFNILNTAMNRTNKELRNMTRTIAFSEQKQYVEALDELYLEVSTGGYSYDTAIKRQVNNLADKGVVLTSKGKEYKLESAVKMNLMTSLTETANDISKETGKIIGADAVWIAPTPFCRPTHRVINGVVMDLKEFKKHEYLTQEPYCYHIVNYIIKDIFEPPYSTSELKKVNNNAEEKYEARQRQNYYARQIRNKKEEIVNLKKTNSIELIDKKKQELTEAQEKYRTFSNANNLEIDYGQCWKQGYNK